jgi:hypothetical protein
MEYNMPILRIVGLAQTLVLGKLDMTPDNVKGASTSSHFEGIGLDD